MIEVQHNYTALLILVYGILILMGAIFFTIAQTRVTGSDAYKNGNAKLNTAKNNLVVAYILGYIAAGMGILLSIIYFGHVVWGITNEIPHLIIFILLFLLVIVSGIFGFMALSDVNNSGIGDKSFITNWIWAAEVVGLIALIVLAVSGAWRANHVVTKQDKKVVDVSTTHHEVTYTVPDTTVYAPAALQNTDTDIETNMDSDIADPDAPPDYPAPLV